MYLLDISVLLAFRYAKHVHHLRAARWIRDVKPLGNPACRFATCSIVELGFIRIASGGSQLAANLSAARADLRLIKEDLTPILLADELEGNQLPHWVSHSKQTTDGHLLELATRHKMRFATLDGGIPGAFEVPRYDERESMIRESPPPLYGAAA